MQRLACTHFSLLELEINILLIFAKSFYPDKLSYLHVFLKLDILL